MDSQRFIKPTYPDFRPQPSSVALDSAQKQLNVPDKRTGPVEDNRYPGYASMMQDGRLATDYKSHCANNVVSSEYGNSFRSWLQHHADGFIQVSRHRQAESAGAYYHTANTPVTAKHFQQCDEFDCTITRTGLKDSIGLERSERVPELFGTFASQSVVAPMNRIFLTDKFEGGRNTPHGRKFKPLGRESANPRDAGYGASG